MTTKTRKLLLHSCPRCEGDLLHDAQEDEFVCLQCGRHAAPALIAQLTTKKLKLPVAA